MHTDIPLAVPETADIADKAKVMGFAGPKMTDETTAAIPATLPTNLATFEIAASYKCGRCLWCKHRPLQQQVKERHLLPDLSYHAKITESERGAVFLRKRQALLS